MEQNNNAQKVEKKFWWLGLQIALIFGIPAFSALFLGKFLDRQAGTGKIITLSLLVCAFVVSWVVLSRKVRSLTRELKRASSSTTETETL